MRKKTSNCPSQRARSWLMGSLMLSLAFESPAQCVSRAFSQIEAQVLSAYLAYYGRPGDAGGLAFWSDRLGTANGNLDEIIDAFAQSAEYNARFGGLSNDALVENLYQQLLGRAAEPAGKAFYVTALTEETKTLQTIALDIFHGAQNTDKAVVDNRLTVAQHYVVAAEGRATEPALTADELAAFVLKVDSQASSAATVCAEITERIHSANDFTPASGAAGNVDGNGPWNRRIRIATSQDGFSWQRTGVTLSDQADVPAIILRDGIVWAFYVMWQDATGALIDTTVAAYSADLVNWTYKSLQFSDRPETMRNQVDPTVVEYAPGKYRMYFTSNARTYSATSVDLLSWTVEEGVRYEVDNGQVLDPNLVWVEGVGNEAAHYEFFAGGTPNANHHAISYDGLQFESLADFSTTPFVVMANGAKIGEDYRYFGFTQEPGQQEKHIRMLTYAGESQWTLNEDILLRVDGSTGEEATLVGDPAVTNHPLGEPFGYVMLYSTQIPD